MVMEFIRTHLGCWQSFQDLLGTGTQGVRLYNTRVAWHLLGQKIGPLEANSNLLNLSPQIVCVTYYSSCSFFHHSMRCGFS